MFRVTLEQLGSLGADLQAHEAVAIVQTLIHAGPGSLAPDGVELREDGSVVCVTCAGSPSLAEAARLLSHLLPPSTRVPAALRYAIARGVGEVEASPFESLEAFSTTLARFETGDRVEIVRALLQRLEFIATPGRLPAEDSPALKPKPLDDPATRDEASALGEAATPVGAFMVGGAAQRDETSSRTEAATPVEEMYSPGAVLLRHDSWTPQRSSSRRWTALVVVVALIASALSGYIFMSGDRGRRALRHVRQQPPSTLPAAPPAPAPEPEAPEAPIATAGQSEPSELTEPTAKPTLLAPLKTLDAAGPAFSPAFSSNGSAIFFHTGGPRDASSAIAMAFPVNSASTDPRTITVVDDGSRNYHAQPSPDGRFIAFDSDREGERGVYVANRDGSDVHRISGPGYAAVPTWAPDGSGMAYVRAEADRPTVWNLWLKPEGGIERRITDYGYGQTWGASWFRDARRITYTHEDTLIVLDLTTGQSRQFVSPVKGSLMRTPAAAPDGSRIIFQVLNHGAWIVNLADGSMHRVLDDPTAEEFAWAPDGGRIAFHSKRDGRWRIYEFAGK